jgi:hypothetical protein
MKVKFVSKDSANYPDLTVGNVYQVIGIEADDYRVLNDEGQPYLYSHSLFTIVDAKEPAEWETEYGEDGERYAYPPELNASGFFEDYFDGRPEEVQIFRRYLNKQRALRHSLTEIS